MNKTKNSDWLQDYACPMCGHTSPLIIDAVISGLVYDDKGMDLESEISWDDYSNCECPECHFAADMSAFKISEEETKECQKN